MHYGDRKGTGDFVGQIEVNVLEAFLAARLDKKAADRKPAAFCQFVTYGKKALQGFNPVKALAAPIFLYRRSISTQAHILSARLTTIDSR